MKKLFIAILAFFVSATAFSQTQVENVSDTLEVYFRQGYSSWDPAYMGNGQRMEAFVKRFDELHNKDRVFNKISKIHIVSGCSPEGSWVLNQKLSKNRATRIRSVLKSYISLPDSVIVEDSRGVNWAGLREMVVADPNVPYKEEVLEKLDNAPELQKNDQGKMVEVRKLRLMYLRDGKPWQYMYKNHFPHLRSFNLQIVIEWEKYEAVKTEVAGGDTIPARPYKMPPLGYFVAWPEVKELPQPVDSGNFYMAIKTNLLYDALITPNIGVEFYLGKRWSVAGNWMYAWWKSDPDSWYHRTYGGDL